MSTLRNSADIFEFHAHVYFDEKSKAHAALLRDFMANKMGVTVGRMHERGIGPHPQPQFAATVLPQQLGSVLMFLQLNRGDCTVLLHPRTGPNENAEEFLDHTSRAVWLGAPLKLDFRYIAPPPAAPR